MKPIPLSNKQFDNIISNLNQDIQDDFGLLSDLDSAEITDDNGEVISEAIKKEFREELVKKLEIESIYKNVTLYRKLNLIVFNDNIFE